MKITKTKIAAASFGAALTSLYAAPELSADDTDTSVVEVTSFVPNFVPEGTVPGYSSSGVNVVFNGLTAANYSSTIDFTIFNNGTYGFGVAGGSDFVQVSTGDMFCGTAGPAQLSFTGTGPQAVGFVINGVVGYFRVDLGAAGVADGVTFIDGALAVGPDGTPGTSDFSVTIPDLPGGSPIKGDIDGDGDVDFEDIPGFISLLTGGGFQAEADIDMDGDVDFEDIPLFIQLLTGGSVNAQAGLPGLAMGADGLRARRMAATA